MVQTEVFEMWRAERPLEDRPAAGLPILSGVRHATVYGATREDGAYNHHCRLVRFKGKFYGMWSNHPCGEGAPGMRVLWAASDDGREWSGWQVLFPRPGPVEDYNALGLAATPGRWLVVDGSLLATCGLFATVGFCDRGQAKPRDISAVRDGKHPSKFRDTYAFLARRVHPNGSLGPIFALWDNLPPRLAFDVQPASEQAPEDLWSIITELVSKPDDLPTFAAAEGDRIKSFCRRLPGYSPERLRYRMHYPSAEDGHRLSEPVTFPARDGRLVLLARDPLGSHRMHASFSVDGGLNWPAARPTDIPDAPSRSTSLVLEDGTVLLIGNQIAPRFEDAGRRHYRRDPLTVAVSRDGTAFTRVYALRYGAPKMRIDGVGGRGPGFQYPGAVVGEGKLHVLYSVGKEDIECLSVPLDRIVPGIADSS